MEQIPKAGLSNTLAKASFRDQYVRCTILEASFRGRPAFGLTDGVRCESDGPRHGKWSCKFVTQIPGSNSTRDCTTYLACNLLSTIGKFQTHVFLFLWYRLLLVTRRMFCLEKVCLLGKWSSASANASESGWDML